MLRSGCLRLTMWRAEEWTSWLPDRPHPVLSRKRGGAWGPEGSVQLCREQPPALTHTSPCLEFSPGQLACLLSLSLVAFGNHILATTAPGSSFWPCLTVLHLISCFPSKFWAFIILSRPEWAHRAWQGLRTLDPQEKGSSREFLLEENNSTTFLLGYAQRSTMEQHFGAQALGWKLRWATDFAISGKLHNLSGLWLPHL